MMHLSAYLELRGKLHLNPLAQLVVLLASGIQVMDYVEPWMWVLIATNILWHNLDNNINENR